MSAERFTSDDAFIGCTLGSYRITGVLGVGGMGSVYRAQHELLDRPAAIKLLRPELTANDELVQRFFNEAKAATAIRHPGIVEVYDFGSTEDGLAYLVMELIDGQPLSAVLAARGRLPESEAAQIARGIASALKAAHAKGIIHRDLKPDNVLLVPDPDGRDVRVKILDFGIAKLANPPPSDRRATQTGALLGTPKYMAPEQAREAAAIDHRADLYSLGCILYELLVGEPPFLADGAGEIIAMQLFNEPVPPSQRAQVSPEMDRLVLRLLAKEPSARPQTAAALMEALVPAPKRSRLPVLLAGATLAVAAGTVALVMSREPTPAPAKAEVAPAPAPEVIVPPAIEVAPPTPPPPAPPSVVVVKKKTAPRASAKIAPATPVASPPPKSEKLKTENDSPIETDIGEGPRQPKVP